MSTLTAFMLVIVYVGAMIVLIGYICAIRPNILLEPDYSNLSSIFVLLLSFSLSGGFEYPAFNSTSFTLSDFFYSYQGFFSFPNISSNALHNIAHGNFPVFYSSWSISFS